MHATDSLFSLIICCTQEAACITAGWGKSMTWQVDDVDSLHVERNQVLGVSYLDIVN